MWVYVGQSELFDNPCPQPLWEWVAVFSLALHLLSLRVEDMKTTIFFAIATGALLVAGTASAIEFQYTGAAEKLKEASTWCASEAQKMIGGGAIDAKYTNALYNALMLEKLKSDGGFQGTKCNDIEISEIS